MINNFDKVKVQLAELAEAVNKFKSESVQLKIVELIFSRVGTPPHGEEANETGATSSRKRTRRQRKAATSPPPENGADVKKRSAAKAKGTGPASTLEQFIQEGFFAQKRTIGAVVEHCKTKAKNFKNNELSGPLGRLVRSEKLSRTKNADGQWEYIKK